MIDIYDLELHYISTNPQPSLEEKLSEHGFTNVSHFEAINGKKLFTPDQLIKDKLITARSYNDLRDGREQYTGLTTLGAIGCTYSHYIIWKKCVDNNLDFIIVAEDDLVIPKKFSDDDLEFIDKTLSQENGVFISSGEIKNKNKAKKIYGTQFYIVSNGACRKLMERAFPIDIQTDAFICHMDDIGEIHLGDRKITRQSAHKSSIQLVSIKTLLPKENAFYYKLLTIVSVLIVYIILDLYNHYKVRKIN